ncbi:MAG: molybdopterin-binding protein [Lysobacter sp.]
MTRPLDQALAVVRDVAASRRLESETLALSRCHGRVVQQDVASIHIAGPAGNADPAIRYGWVMTPARVALAASLGIPALSVARRPTVAVFTTGNDLIEPGMPLAAGQAYDGSRELLMGLLRAEGLEPTAWPRLPDDPRQIEIALRDAGCAFDLVVICESPTASAGAFVAKVLGQFGTVHLNDMPTSFGAPVLFGSLDQARVLGLPDDPLALTAAWLTLGRALVDGLQGRIEPRLALRARLTRPVDLAQLQGDFVPARIEVEGDGLRVDPRMSGLADSHGLILLQGDSQTFPATAIVDVIPL